MTPLNSFSSSSSKTALALLREKRNWYERNGWSIPHTLEENEENVDGKNNTDLHLIAESDVLEIPRMSILLMPNKVKNKNISGRDNEWNGGLISDDGLYSGISPRPLVVGTGVTELAGEAGSGKTQICLGLCVTCVSIQIPPPQPLRPSSDGNTNIGNDINDKKSNKNDSNDHNISHVITSSPRRGSFASNSSLPKRIPISAISNPYRRKHRLNTLMQMRHDIQKEGKGNGNISHHRLPPSRSPKVQPPHRPGTKYFYRAMYVSMGEGAPQSQIARRLRQIVGARIKCGVDGDNIGDMESAESEMRKTWIESMMQRILIRSVRNEEEFRDLLEREIPKVLESSSSTVVTENNVDTTSTISAGRVGLLILDSIAGIFRLPDVSDGNGMGGQNFQTPSLSSASSSWSSRGAFYRWRSSILFDTSSTLREISDRYGCAVVITNQVTSVPGYRHMVPSLGLAWSSCVNSRYLLTRVSGYSNGNVDESDNMMNQGQDREVEQHLRKSSQGRKESNYPMVSSSREIHLLFSSKAPAGPIGSFRIDSEGCIYTRSLLK